MSDPPGMPPAVDVIVVNFNAGEALLRCIRSVLEQDLPVSLTLVDNASTDGSAERAAAEFGGRPGFSLLRSPDNPGFATAINRAVALSLHPSPAGDTSPPAPRPAADYLLILNPDCELAPGALAALCRALAADPAAGLAGPLVTDAAGRARRGTLRRFPDPWKSFLTFSGLWRLGRRWPRFRGVEVDGALPDAVTAAEAVSGACMLLRRSAFLAAGCMDARYGLHCEDLDLMYRLRQGGLHCLYVPQARAVHHQGLSSRSRPLWVHWQKHRGMQRFFQKFQARRYTGLLGGPLGGMARWAVIAGIWARFALTLPPILLRNLLRR
ncbi:MAG: glycosyltransferase family 2 protein [Lysobacterales bacterium]|nr:MAG: glycosyltransferase family 2 protein [Xanthomonadales bacterium]